MPTLYETEGFKILDGVSFTGTNGQPGSSMSWTSISNEPNSDHNHVITDTDDDGLLDAGVDTVASPIVFFTGYTITSGGVEYPIFRSGDIYAVFLPQDGTTQTLIPNAPGTSNAYQAEATTYLCFAAGTDILTPGGQVAIAALAIGDLVQTAEGRAVPAKWIGRQTVKEVLSGPHMQPVRIRAGALGNGLPYSDLTVTADHGMVLDGLVINASALVNGDSIDWVPMAELPERVTYYHIETENHDVILANGAPAETFVDIPGRKAFDNYQDYLDLYGAERIIPEMDRPRISARRLLPDAIRARLGIVDEVIDFDQPLRA